MTITWDQFEAVEIRVGTIIAVDDFPEARNPAYRLSVDFGEAGVKRSSAQITTLYSKDELLGKQVVGVLNFPPKQIANFFSECLVTGFVRAPGEVVLAVPEREVPNGTRLA